MLAAGMTLTLSAADTEEKLPVLVVGSEIYSNVVVTSVTATDIYFNHSAGIGNAKLKNLSPELQKHFHFDWLTAGTIEKKQGDATTQFQRNLQIQAAEAKDRLPAATYDSGDLVVPKIFAHSFRGERPPPMIVEKWLTPEPPSREGKFIFLVFWLTSAEQCRNAVPHIDELSTKFNDRMITIGLSNEPEVEMVKMKSPKVQFYVGTDTQSRSLIYYEVTSVPHAVLIDPKGIVRFEGAPFYLSEKDLAHLLDEYGP